MRLPSSRSRPSRRSILKSAVAASVAPWLIPARLLGEEKPSNKTTVGVIGVGAQGHNDMRNFLSQDDVRVTAICDVNKQNIDRAKKRIAEVYGKPDVKTYTDFRELNANPDIDAVLMALPVHWHSVPSIDAILNGKHIFHEKPMAMSFQEARRVREAVSKKGVVFQFGTQQRSDLRFRWACELALNGRLGKLKEIQVAVPSGHKSPLFPQQSTPDWVDWDRWVGPAPMTPFHEQKLRRGIHENISNFSLGMISCWGIHHLDIAQWGNGIDETGPTSIEGTGVFPEQGSCDAILKWKARFEFAKAAPITFVSHGMGLRHGVRFIGETSWVHVSRGRISAPDGNKLLKDPLTKCGKMPIRLPVSNNHTRNFVDAIKNKTRAICDIGPSVRGDMLCQLALIAIKQKRKLQWDPKVERFVNDKAADAMLQPRHFRGDWKLPEIK